MIVVMLLIVSMLISLLGLARLVGIIFSNKIRQNLRGKSFDLFLMLLAIPVTFFLFNIIHPGPHKKSVERKETLKLVEAAGGWEAIVKDCQLLSKQNTNKEVFIWWKWAKTNSVVLPPAIAALKPIEVRYYPYDPIPIIKIHVMGMHSTDGAWPTYNLWYVCHDMPPEYMPAVGSRNGWFGFEVRKITNSLFEITD